MPLDDLKTPCLILDRAILRRNCAAMAGRMTAHGVRLRPHMKTAKSADVAALATAGHFGGITVSTLAEAAYFAERGYRDLTYAVGMAAAKVEEAAEVARGGCRLSLLTDDLGAARDVAERAATLGVRFPMLIEVDTGGLRGGVAPDSEDLLAIGRLVDASDALDLEGVLCHAGHSYHCNGVDEIRQVAEEERAGAVRAAARLRDAGLPCPVVSIGSTPTAVHAAHLDGVTEMRPGVYMFGDLDQVSIGSCAMSDIALSVLATVIGHNTRAERILTDAGGLAMSKDRGSDGPDAARGYGQVMGHDGLYVDSVHQEHGLIAMAGGGPPPYDALPIGSRVRILPNHACMTAAAHDRYHVIESEPEVVEVWDRVNGW